jgi:VWFA-related protein
MRAAVTIAYLLALGQAPQTPPIKSGVTLVTVDVTVVDAEGHPVPDLTAADFEIRLNNRVQPIRGFSYLQVAPQTMAGAVGPSFDAAPASPAAPAAKAAVGVPRVFIILVDDLSFSPLAGKGLLSAAQRFMTSLPAADVVGLTTSSGTVIVNPTMDRASVVAAVSRITGAFQDPRVVSSGPSEGKFSSPDQQVGLAQALAIDRGEQGVLRDAIVAECFHGDQSRMPFPTIEDVLAHDSCARTVQLSAMRTAAQLKAVVRRQTQAYEGVIRAMGTAAGIRHLVVLTDGVALAQDLAAMQPVARAAAEVGVQLSVMMDTPDNVSAADGGRRVPPPGQVQQPDTGAPQRRREDNQLLLNGARTTADMTGAEFYQVTGEPDRLFARVAVAASGIYRIAVEAPADTSPGTDFALVARVPRRSEVTARANRHAVAVSPAAAAASAPAASSPTARGPAAPSPGRALVTPEEQMRRAIATGRALNGLVVTLDPAVRRGADPGQIAIDVVITVTAAAQGPVTTIFGLVDAAGALRTSDKTLTGGSGDGYRLAFTVPVAPGAYRLRFAAADAGGTVGAIETPVDATLAKMGPLETSGILVEALPGDGRRIIAAIEVYPPPGAAAPDLIVKLTLVSSAGEPLVERDVLPEEADGRLRAEAEFALDRQPLGVFTLRATLVSGTAELGTLTRQIR